MDRAADLDRRASPGSRKRELLTGGGHDFLTSSAAREVLGDDCGAVRSILFDKTAEANWNVIWHQDLTIAVAAETDSPGYGPWSRKQGVVHVQPPVRVLERMVAVRLHLDPCPEDAGPLRVLPGSHRAGILPPSAIDAWRARPERVCVVDCGGLLLMRPLLLHASSRARLPARRRVLHVEYGPRALPEGVRWHAWLGPEHKRLKSVPA